MKKQEIKKIIDREDPVIFEIGCADGGDTLEFINAFNNLRIYCFEPEPKNIALVRSKILYDNHFLFEGVVSDIDGVVEFHRSRTDNPDDLSYSGSIKTPKEHLNEWPFIKFDQQIMVQSITLDSFCRQERIDSIDFIWSDVQGAEDNLIRGGRSTLDTKVRYFYTEYSNKEYYDGQLTLRELKELLGDGWDIIQDYGTDVLFKNNRL